MLCLLLQSVFQIFETVQPEQFSKYGLSRLLQAPEHSHFDHLFALVFLRLTLSFSDYPL